MITVIKRGRGISVRRAKDGTAIYFGPVSASDISHVFDSFYYAKRGSPPGRATAVHIGWAGFRGNGYYDDPDLWGIEVRSVSKRLPPHLHHEILDSVQHAIVTRDFGTTREDLMRWVNKNPEKRSGAGAGNEIRSLWYNDGQSRAIEKRQSMYTAAGFTDSEWTQLTSNHIELGMVVHDWSQDTLLIDHPERLGKIQAEQNIALKKLKAGEDPSSVMKSFLVQSGIYESVLKSIGLQLAK
jgi:hypothetical protein